MLYELNINWNELKHQRVLNNSINGDRFHQWKPNEPKYKNKKRAKKTKAGDVLFSSISLTFTGAFGYALFRFVVKKHSKSLSSHNQ